MQPLWEASQVTSSGDLEPVISSRLTWQIEGYISSPFGGTMLKRRADVVVLVWSGLVGVGWAQVDTATITGRVTDPSGSVIPDVRINLVQPETNFRFQAVTNAEGIFRLQSLQPGTYQITFEASGFKRLVQDNIILQTGAVAPVDARLEVGSASESCR